MKKINIIFLVIIVFALLFLLNIKKTQYLEARTNTFSKYVVTNQDSNIYTIEESVIKTAGLIKQGEELILENISFGEYYKISSLGKEYYINYKNVDKIKRLNNEKKRYKRYIPYNKNIITKDITNLYDENGTLIYSLNSSYEFEVIINKSNHYGVEFNNKLLYIKNEDILKTVNSTNSNLKNIKEIAVLNYHFFYDDSKQSEIKDCNQQICISTSNFKKHLEYINSENIFTPTMKELEMYIDGIIQLPKSVVLTIDDGWRAEKGKDLATQYEINTTVFLMSKYYNPKNYRTEYTEVHSHGWDIHNKGVCPGGQGGAIKCLEKSKLLEDLQKSREKLSGTTVFCYPFYEYNDYSIEVLKEAGFTMAFAGPGSNGNERVHKGSNKYTLPRYIIYKNTTVNDIKKYIG